MTAERQAFLDSERAKILDATEAAYILRTTKATILKMCRTHTLPHWREGSVIRIHLDSLTPTREVSHEPSIPQLPVERASAEAQYEGSVRRFRAAHSSRRASQTTD